MVTVKPIKFLQIGLIIAMAAGASACASKAEFDELKSDVKSLEAKVNQALQKSASAKIDATTALDVAQKNRKK